LVPYAIYRRLSLPSQTLLRPSRRAFGIPGPTKKRTGWHSL